MFVLERADTMNDEAANALLKTLEEPPAYVVLLLLTDRPTQVLPTIASRCQPVRFDPLPPARARRAAAGARRRRPRRPRPRARLASATASGRSRSRSATAPRCARRAEAFARAPLHGRVGAERPWRALLELAARARRRGARGARGAARRGARSSCPRKEHKRRETEIGEQARRAERRAQTAALDHGAPARRAVVPRPGLRRRRARPSSPTTPTAPPALAEDAEGRDAAAPARRASSWSTTPARGSRSTSPTTSPARRSPSGSSARS